MYDGGKIITGIVIFVVLVLFPFLYTAAMGEGGTQPEPQIPTSHQNNFGRVELYVS